MDVFNFIYRRLVLELCAGTLTDYCEKKYDGPELPPNVKVLNQIANGLHYIHSQNLVHRDVKPDNILISKTTPVQMKLSDFGFVKKTSSRGTYTQSGLKGTEKWMAPEILELVDDTITELPHGTIQSDTFAAGCVFFYVVTRGKHPFGNFFEILNNISKNNPIELIEHKQSKYYICNCMMVFARAAHHFSDHRFARPKRIDRKNDQVERAKNLIAGGHQTLDSQSRCVT